MIRKLLRKWLPRRAFCKPSRLDHNRMYMCVIVGLFLTSLSMIILGPLPGSSLSDLSEFTKMSMAFVMLIASGLCIYGMLKGTKLYKPNADLRDSYSIAKWSTPVISVSLAIYIGSLLFSYGTFWLSALSGSVGTAIFIGTMWCGWDFANEIDHLTEHLRKEAK